jgi:deoxycytidine triphosphate deaminase
MTILTNEEIKKLVAGGKLISNAHPACFQPCSYDLRIGSIFRDGQVIDDKHARRNEQISLAPGEVITMTTLEELDLPPDIAATAHAINAQSSEGLLVLNPGHVDPGYRGPLTVMAINMRRVPFVVSREDKIFTVVFQRLSGPANPAYVNRSETRADKERDLNKKVVEKAVTSLADLISINAPFTRPEDVDKRIRQHWSTIATMILGGIAAGAALLAAIATIASLSSGNGIPQTSKLTLEVTRGVEGVQGVQIPRAATELAPLGQTEAEQPPVTKDARSVTER